MTAKVETDIDARAYHDFLLGVKLHWSNTMYQQLKDVFDARSLAEEQRFADVDSAEKAMRDEPVYQLFGWVERNLQRIKYAGPRGILAVVDGQRETLQQVLEEAAAEGQRRDLLRLAEAMEYPDYYAKVDFHQHPGGVWRDDLAGFAYEFGRRTTMPAHMDPFGIHDRAADVTPTGDFKRILDWGCGTGGSTFPFAERYPGAEVHGLDLSAPCLKVAYLRAAERGLDIHWSQQRMEQTDFPDNHFDMLHSTFLLHELPKHAQVDIVREAHRILRPGGWFVNLDFHSPPGGVWGQFIHYGHARRNNEVFMRSFCETDFIGMQRDAGFSSAEMRSFDDGTGPVAADEAPAAWRFPWQLFVAQK